VAYGSYLKELQVSLSHAIITSSKENNIYKEKHLNIPTLKRILEKLVRAQSDTNIVGEQAMRLMN
jgi:hypothetical protein